MLFNSFEFALFFPIVTILYFLFPHRFRWVLLLVASCFFYMFFKPVYILILVFTIVIDYFTGIWISRQENHRKRKLLLLLSIAANLSVLIVFKYFDFFAVNFNHVLWFFNRNASGIPLMDILLPIGLSFHTMQAMSYNIEIYRRKQQPEKHFGIYALFIMFYPQLVAGPIERPQHMLPQFHEAKKFNYENFRRGLILIAWGLFKKVVIADRLAIFVNTVYNHPNDFVGIPLIIATLFFSIQIYCDFSGYSDIAVGTAKCMGFNLVQNFNRPYTAVSIQDFWRRWHISLSTWFRDYIYQPLGGNHVSYIRWCFNIFIVFLLSGLWHGARWTFIAWGLLHAIFYILDKAFQKQFPDVKYAAKARLILTRTYVFILVSLAWIFFRSSNISSAVYILKNLFTGIGTQLRLIYSNQNHERLPLLYLNHTSVEFLMAVISILILLIIESKLKLVSIDGWLINKPTLARWSFYYTLVLIFILFGIFNKSAFIYFQF
ncbi:MAG: membrane-bound O-acyltransferase family protein [Bacteroidetes bacterium]|nr:MAG: membrane-bound O-acyltransferase family protein [Bacteroidota bacterium]